MQHVNLKAATPAGRPPFIETSVSQLVFQTADVALKMCTNAAIAGAPGVGKSAAINEYVRTHSGAMQITITQVLAKSMRHLLMAITGDDPLWCKDDVFRLERRVLRGKIRGYTCFVDEAQNLKFDSMRQLLSLSTEDGGPFNFIFCGNREVLKRVTVDEGAFAQIGGRVSFREDIGGITDRDAEMLASAYGAEGMDTFRLLRDVGATHHARGIVKVMELARILSKASTANVEHVRAALDHLPQYRPASNGKPKHRKAG